MLFKVDHTRIGTHTGIRTTMHMKQIYHDYRYWEDYLNGMWRKENKEYNEKMLKVAIEFTSNHFKYGEAMKKVIKEWKISCEHNLSNKNQNRKAWLGHAACCIELGLPEYLVRQAWKYLTELQQNLANKEAEKYIKQWEKEQRLKNILEHGKKDVIQMEFQMK